MATLTVIPYEPPHYKPSKRVAPQPKSSKKNVLFDFSNLSVEELQASGGMTGSSNLQKKVAGDSKATIEDTQASGHNLVGTQAASITGQHDSDDDTDDEFPSLNRLLSQNYRHRLAEERLLTKSVLEESNKPTTDDNLTDSCGSIGSGGHEKPIILDGDDRSKDNDDNLNTKPAPRTLDSRQANNNVFNSEVPPTLSYRTANERDNGISDDKSNLVGKRRRSVSPNPTLRYTITSPLSYSEDAKSSQGHIDSNDPDESEDGDFRSKRQRLSALVDGKTTLDRTKKGSQRSPSSISEDGTLSISVDSKTANTARPASAGFDSPLLTESQLAAQAIDDNQNWEVRKISGKEDVDGVLHYWVEWASTLEPEHSLGHAKELVDKFEARLRAKLEVKNGRGRPALKQSEQAVLGTDVSSSREQRRPRGRPRKQT